MQAGRLPDRSLRRRRLIKPGKIAIRSRRRRRRTCSRKLPKRERLQRNGKQGQTGEMNKKALSRPDRKTGIPLTGRKRYLTAAGA